MTDWHVTWRGQNWGRPGDMFGVVDFGELFDSADSRVSTVDLIGDGVYPGETWLGSHTFNLHLLASISDEADLSAAKALMGQASAPPTNRNAEELFSVTCPQWDGSRFLIARCLKRQAPSDVASLGVGRYEPVLQYQAFDPAWYGAAVVSEPFGIDSPQTITNDGDYWPTRGSKLWSASITGPLVNVKLYTGDGTGDDGIWYVGTIADGSTLTIDASTKQIRKDGVDVYDACAGLGGFPYPRFFDLPPGDTDVTLHADSGTGHCTFTMRPTWS